MGSGLFREQAEESSPITLHGQLEPVHCKPVHEMVFWTPYPMPGQMRIPTQPSTPTFMLNLDDTESRQVSLHI